MKKTITVFAVIFLFCSVLYCENIPRVLVDNMEYFGMTMNEYNCLGLSRVQKEKVNKIRRRVNSSGLENEQKFITLRNDFYGVLKKNQKETYENILVRHCIDYYWDVAYQLYFSDTQEDNLERLIDKVYITSDRFEKEFLNILSYRQKLAYNDIKNGRYVRNLW